MAETTYLKVVIAVIRSVTPIFYFFDLFSHLENCLFFVLKKNSNHSNSVNLLFFKKRSYKLKQECAFSNKNKRIIQTYYIKIKFGDSFFFLLFLECIWRVLKSMPHKFEAFLIT